MGEKMNIETEWHSGEGTSKRVTSFVRGDVDAE